MKSEVIYLGHVVHLCCNRWLILHCYNSSFVITGYRNAINHCQQAGGNFFKLINNLNNESTSGLRHVRKELAAGYAPRAKKRKQYLQLEKTLPNLWDEYDKSKDYKAVIRHAAHLFKLEPLISTDSAVSSLDD